MGDWLAQPQSPPPSEGQDTSRNEKARPAWIPKMEEGAGSAEEGSKGASVLMTMRRTLRNAKPIKVIENLSLEAQRQRRFIRRLFD